MSGIIQYFSNAYYKHVSPEEYVFIEESEDKENQNSLASITSSDEEISESESVNSNCEDYHFRKSSDSEDPDRKTNKLALTNLMKEEVSDSEEDTKVQDRDDTFSLFPEEIIIHIFNFLSPKELTFCATVCQSWKRLMDSDFLWKPLCRGEEINSLAASHLNWKETYKHSTESILLKAAQKREPRLKTLEGHSDEVGVLQLKGNKLVSGSDDNSIKIWNLSTYDCIETLEGHSNSVEALQFQEEKLASGSSDKTIKIWDLSNGKCTKTFENAKGVSSLQFHRNTLVSGSWNGKITIWDLSASKSIRTLEEHSVEITVLKIKGNILASGSFDGTIKIWDLLTYECVKTLKLSDVPRSLQFKGATLVCGTNQGEIRILNLSSYEWVQTLQENSSKNPITAIEIQGKAVVSGDREGTIKIWDLSSPQPIKKWKADFYPVSLIRSLQLQGTTLFSGGADDSIKIWDFSKKKE